MVMKLIYRAFTICLFFLMPISCAMKNSKMGQIIAYNKPGPPVLQLQNADVVPPVKKETSIVVQPVVVKAVVKNTANNDSLLSEIANRVRSLQSKQDTGLRKLTQGFQTQTDQIADLKAIISHRNTEIKGLKQKSKITTEVIKEAKRGNAQAEVFRLIVIIAFGVYVLIGFAVAIFVQSYKNRHKPYYEIE